MVGGHTLGKKTWEGERAEGGLQGCRETRSKETGRKGKIREPLVHCYSFSCGDIVKFPQGWRNGR